MTLYLLKPIEDLPEQDDPWDPWYDKAFGFVIRAETESAARVIAHKNGGDENGKRYPWLSAKYSTCEILETEGPEEMILRDLHSA